MLSEQQESPSPRRSHFIVFSFLMVAAVALVFIRFPPADLAGWIASSLDVTLGVSYLLAAVLFFGANRSLDNTTAARRVLRRIALVATLISLTLGLLLITTSV